jgi:hypothetical protein
MDASVPKEHEWLQALSDEDVHFVKRFVLASGSLKDLATQFGVSYPTLRLRLDRLIEKIRLCEGPASQDPFRLLVRTLVVDGRRASGDAKRIIHAHEKGGKAK